MDFKAIQELIKGMSNSDLSYLEVETDGIHITMKKGVDSEPSRIVTIPKEKNAVENIKADIADEHMEQNGVEEVKTSKEDSRYFTVVSPIVGTFYGSSSPDSPNYVNVGSKVKKGDTLCIIEAMKLMNEIESEIDGEVVEILASNEQMVEYGQELFKIKPLGVN